MPKMHNVFASAYNGTSQAVTLIQKVAEFLTAYDRALIIHNSVLRILKLYRLKKSILLVMK